MAVVYKTAGKSALSLRTAPPYSRWQTVFLSFILIVASVAIYAPVRHYVFFNVDDNFFVYQDAHVLGPLNWSTVHWAFTHTFVDMYEPLTFLAHNLDVQLFQVDPGRHHQVNMGLHALNAVLLFWVFRRSTGWIGRSFMVAALFALHPVNVENVAWIAELKTLLSSTFFFLALGVYDRSVRGSRSPRMGVVAVLYWLALLAKPQAITLPFVLLLWDYWPLGRMFPAADGHMANSATGSLLVRSNFLALVKEKTPLFIVAVLDAVVTMSAEHKTSPADWPYTFSIRLGNAILCYVRYLGKALWPVHLAYLYPHPGTALRWGAVWGALLLLIVLSIIAVGQRRRRYLLVGWLWFLGTLLPMIGLVQVDVPAMADRYAYVSFVGIFLMVCWCVAEWAEGAHLPKLLLPATSVVVLVVLAAITHRQVGYWSDSIAVYRRSVQVTNRNWVAELNLGALLTASGRADEGLPHLYRAAQYNPGNADINLNLGLAQQQRGDFNQAISYYQKAEATSKSNTMTVRVLRSMAKAYEALGDDARARECDGEALRLGPGSAPQ